MDMRWFELRQKVKSIGRPLTCPICHYRFAWRHYNKTAKACPHCKVQLGCPFYYRAILAVVAWSLMAYVMYWGYQQGGSDGAGWLLIGWPFALVIGLFGQAMVLRAFPPKLEPYAEGSTWLKLT